MSGPQELNISFRHRDTDYNVDLVKGQKSDQCVEINGVSYAILGDKKRLEAACKILSSVSLDSISSSQDLAERLSLHKDVTLVQVRKTNDIGINTLKTTSLEKTINIKEILDDICGEKNGIRDLYIFKGIGAACVNHIREREKEGAYKGLDLEKFVETINKDLYEITGDLHLRLRLDPHDEFTMTAEMLPDTDNIGHIYLRGFGPVKTSNEENTDKTPEQEKEDKEAINRKQEFASNIQKLKEGNAKYIILDLRENDGGSPDSAQLLCSYFMKPNIELSSIKNRDGSVTTFHTLSADDIAEENRLLDVPVYILTSSKTFSAAEKFVNDMRLARSGTVVIGEKTKGGANPGSALSFGEFPDSKGKIRTLDIVIPQGTTMPFKNQPNWERRGIIPDEQSSASDALETSLKLIEKTKKSLRRKS